MFDTDGNERVDKNEFLVVSTVLISAMTCMVLHQITRFTKINYYTQVRTLLAGKKIEDRIAVS